MKVGDYVRTKKGIIHKITDLKPYYENGELIIEKQLVYIDYKCSGWDYEQFSEIILKSSPNIIDLIEVGDYVNGVMVTEIKDGKPFKEDYNDPYYSYYFDDIYSIVTKEQFSQMEYRIGE